MLHSKYWLTAASLALVLVACGGAEPTLLPEPPTPPVAIPTLVEDVRARGPVYINETELLIMESFPIQVALRVQGELPTPCHLLEYEVTERESPDRLEVELYSLAPVQVDCIQVLEPFEESIPLGSFQDGRFTVFLNGERVGAFDA